MSDTHAVFAELPATRTLEQLAVFLGGRPEVVALIVKGSLAQVDATPDRWSDLDAMMVVTDNELDHYYPATDWLAAAIGPILGHTFQSPNGMRLYFQDGRGLDLIVSTESNLRSLDSWTASPFCQGYRIEFQRSDWVTEHVEELNRRFPTASPASLSAERYRHISDGFWWSAAHAITRLARNELFPAIQEISRLEGACGLLSWRVFARPGKPFERGFVREGNAPALGLISDRIDGGPVAQLADRLSRCCRVFTELSEQWDPSAVERADVIRRQLRVLPDHTSR
ncbi:MAG: aminoglycoside 6-adenylyltransferase [Candidatus Dormibacteria bacterium]